MVVYVNGVEITLPPGMTVRHALIQANLLKEIEEGKKVYDEWGNEVGPGGALWEGARVFVR